MTRAVIIGCGDTGLRVARLAADRGWDVTGIVRSAESADRLARSAIAAQAVDLDRPDPDLPDADLLFHFAPPPRTGDDDPRLAAVLAAYAHRPPRRLIYIGTSGVYGDCGGDWVTENRPLNPITNRARRRAAAERRLADWAGAAVILRAPGIYGPGRLPIERVRRGEPVLDDADSPWTNRIHIDDLAAATMAAAERGPDRAVYNAADGQPTPMGAAYRAIARRLGLPDPPTISRAEAERDWSEMRLSFLRESRRLDNCRLLEQLGLTLQYPDLESGLDASLPTGG
ncbi:MAG: NAD-dependent epimerase/dehydratase family protein [Salinisphaeraceae bacterium]